MKRENIRRSALRIGIVMGLGSVISLIGVVTLINVPDAFVSKLILKIGIVLVLAAFAASVVMAIRTRAVLGRSTKIGIALLVLLTLPVLAGMVQLIFLL